MVGGQANSESGRDTDMDRRIALPGDCHDLIVGLNRYDIKAQTDVAGAALAVIPMGSKPKEEWLDALAEAGTLTFYNDGTAIDKRLNSRTATADLTDVSDCGRFIDKRLALMAKDQPAPVTEAPTEPPEPPEQGLLGAEDELLPEDDFVMPPIGERKVRKGRRVADGQR